MTTIDRNGLNAVVPTQVGTPLRIRVVFLTGRTNGKGIWLTITRDEGLSLEKLETGRNIFLLESVSCNTAKATKELDLWSRIINIRVRRIAAYFEDGNTESIERLINTIVK